MKNLTAKIAELSPGERQAIRLRRDELIAEELTLRQLRELLGLTQEEIAERLEIGQDNVSRLERRDDIKLSTLRGYVEALGGQLHVSASFPDRAQIELSSTASPPTPRSARG